METSTIIELITIVITLILGVISKKVLFIKTNFIPIQNLLIGLISFTAYYIATKDIHIALMFSGLLAGGTYDLLKNIKKIGENEELLQDAVEYNELSEGENETNGNS